MSELFASPFFGIGLSVVAFWIGIRIQKKTGLVVCNPLIIAIALVVGVLLVLRIPYEDYNQGGSIINMFLAPATACLAVSVYTRLSLLKRALAAHPGGCCVGSAVSMAACSCSAASSGWTRAMTASLLPKSVTTPIAVGISSQPRGRALHHGGGRHPHRHHRRIWLPC